MSYYCSGFSIKSVLLLWLTAKLLTLNTQLFVTLFMGGSISIVLDFHYLVNCQAFEMCGKITQLHSGIKFPKQSQ